MELESIFMEVSHLMAFMYENRPKTKAIVRDCTRPTGPTYKAYKTYLLLIFSIISHYLLQIL